MKKILIIITAFIFHQSTMAQGGWFWQNPLPQGNTLNSVCFVSATTGWTVGGYGTILNTTDGGENWIIQSSGTTENLYSVCFVTETNGWAVSDHTIIYTIDGGNTWNPQYHDNSINIHSIDFVDHLNGWAVGHVINGIAPILHTSDGGNSWTPQSSESSALLSSVHFISFRQMKVGWWVVD